MHLLLELIFLLRCLFLSAQVDYCVLSSNSLTDFDSILQLRVNQTCSEISVARNPNFDRLIFSGQLWDYQTHCRHSISNAIIEIIHLTHDQQLICYEKLYSDHQGIFQVNTSRIFAIRERIFLRISAANYNIVVKEIDSQLILKYSRTINTRLDFVLTIADESMELETVQNKMSKFIDQLMAQMTLKEKIGQLNLPSVGFDVTGPVISQNVDDKIRNGLVGGVFNTYTPKAVRALQELAINSTRLKIPLLFGYDVIHGHRTIFPICLGLSSTWDLELIEKSARIAAQEVTADGLNWVFSPMVDIARDPRWGRISEGSGEDPWLGSQIAAAMVRGYQGKDLSQSNTVLACVKHFAAYGAAESGRDYNTADVSRITMYQTYLPPYRAAIDAGVGSVMTSFNEVDSIPSSGNSWLLDDLLRKQWKFKGLVVTDYTAINEMTAHGLGDLQEVSARALNAGVDMDMVGEGYITTLEKSLQQGKVNEEKIDQACRRILEAKYLLGLFDDPFRYCDEARAQNEIYTVEHRIAARDIALRSFVLLKTDRKTLPLSRSNINLALIGPLADDQRSLIGEWSAAGDWRPVASVRTGISTLMGDRIHVSYAQGCNIIDDISILKQLNANGAQIVPDSRSTQEMIDEAVDVAKKSNVVVAVLGEHKSMSGEAASRADIGLPANQQSLLKALFDTGKPVVIVLMNGRPLTLTWEDQHAAAILETWFAGSEAGNAIAEMLFGYYNPSGKLTATFPRHVGQIPLYYNHKNTGRPFNASIFLDKYKVGYVYY